MKLAQRKIKWLARLMLGLTLFAQGVVAANACVAPTASPVQAYTQAVQAGMVEHDEEAMPCHEEKTPNANACLAHCTQSDQISADQHNVQLAAPVSVLSRAIIQPQMRHIRPVISATHLVLDTGPPIPIRFCSFLI